VETHAIKIVHIIGVWKEVSGIGRTVLSLISEYIICFKKLNVRSKYLMSRKAQRRAVRKANGEVGTVPECYNSRS
jgi:hypothetical protein